MNKLKDYIAKLKIRYDYSQLYDFSRSPLFNKVFNGSGYDCKTFQKLEFVGDRVANMLICDILYKNFPSTLMRMEITSTMFSNEFFSNLFFALKLQTYFKGKRRPIEEHDIFECLIAIIYLEQGFNHVKNRFNRFISPLVISKANEIEQVEVQPNRTVSYLLKKYHLGTEFTLPTSFRDSQQIPVKLINKTTNQCICTIQVKSSSRKRVIAQIERALLEKIENLAKKKKL